MNKSTLHIELEGKSFELSSTFREGGEDLLLFVHGLGCSKEAFLPAWEEERLKEYSLLAFDLVGFGEPSKPEDFSYTV